MKKVLVFSVSIFFLFFLLIKFTTTLVSISIYMINIRESYEDWVGDLFYVYAFLCIILFFIGVFTVYSMLFRSDGKIILGYASILILSLYCGISGAVFADMMKNLLFEFDGDHSNLFIMIIVSFFISSAVAFYFLKGHFRKAKRAV